jgi:type IV pilus assembly protein PilV
MNATESRGFTLIEVLVSMVILAIGLLGLAVLQIASMQNTQGGYLRAQATLLAYDIIDRMRANIPGVSAGNYDIALADPAPGGPSCLGAAADCNVVDLGQFDVDQWRASLGAYLPDGKGSIAAADIGATTLVTVNVQWIDPYSANKGAEQLNLVAELMQ